jgi:hypothetical protein
MIRQDSGIKGGAVPCTSDVTLRLRGFLTKKDTIVIHGSVCHVQVAVHRSMLRDDGANQQISYDNPPHLLMHLPIHSLAAEHNCYRQNTEVVQEFVALPLDRTVRKCKTLCTPAKDLWKKFRLATLCAACLVWYREGWLHWDLWRRQQLPTGMILCQRRSELEG